MKKILKAFLALLIVLSIFAFTPFESPTAEATETVEIVPLLSAGQAGTVTGSSVHIRSGAGTNFASLGTVSFGTTVLHLGGFQSVNGVWWENVQITSGNLNGVRGWMSGEFLGNWHTPSARLAQPGNVRVDSITNNSARILWNNVPNAWGYRVERLVGSTWQYHGTVTELSRNASGLAANTQHRFRVRAQRTTVPNQNTDSLWVEITFNTTNTASVTMIRPLATGTVTSEFRSASRPNHHGIDLASSNSRQPILAAATGTVQHVVRNCVEGDRTCGGGFGNWVVIRHNINGQIVDTLYAHLTRVDVNVGNTVVQGQQIGTKGNTGDSTGPHLHFEVHPGGRVSGAASAVNPRNWINFPASGVWW